MTALILEDGTVFEGKSLGLKNKDVIGEVVFNTGMTGYQEVLTDPSYYGQMVNMTYPLIGNYGINSSDNESSKPHVKGFIVREACATPNNWKSEDNLDNYLRKNNIVGISGIDTRSLTRKIREKGTMMGIITSDINIENALEKIMKYEFNNPVTQVTTKEIYTIPGEGFHVAVMDFGIKQSIINSLLNKGCKITVFPAYSTADEICAIKPDGIFLSNGPGDPKENMQIVENIKKLLGVKPIFGICLGHQLLALSKGGDTIKLKYGHRGCNHPVKDIKKDRVYITSQNHSYTIIEDSIINKDMEVTHINLNDGTIEGISYNDMNAFGVQFHPEACSGPLDTGFLFDDFIALMGKNK